MPSLEECKQENDIYFNTKREVINMSNDELYAELNSVINILNHSKSLLLEFGGYMPQLKERLNNINSDYELKKDLIIKELTIRRLPTHYTPVL